MTFVYFSLATSKRSRRQYPASIFFSRKARPFLLCFFKPVVRSMLRGRKAREVFACLVVSITFSFFPEVVELTSSTFLFARPLNLNEFNPVRLPSSAVMIGALVPGLVRMKEELFFMHSHKSSGAAHIKAHLGALCPAGDFATAFGAAFAGAFAGALTGLFFGELFGEVGFAAL